MQYIPGKGFIPLSPLPKNKRPVRGMKKIKYKPEYDDPTLLYEPTKKKPARKKKATTRRKVKTSTANTKTTVARPKKKLPTKKPWWQLW